MTDPFRDVASDSPALNAFLSARVWRDEDGSHLVFEHECRTGLERTMLPSVWKAEDGENVRPSIFCQICGLHYMATVE